MIVGYVRAGPHHPDLDRETTALRAHDVEKIFEDTVSAGSRDRPHLRELLRTVHDGDVVVVPGMDRLACDVADLRDLVANLTGRGVEIRFIAEHLTFAGGTHKPVTTMMVSLLDAVAQFERALARERQAQGIAAAKARGVYRGRAPALTHEQSLQVRQLAAAGIPKATIARQFQISRETVYRILRPPPPTHPSRPPRE